MRNICKLVLIIISILLLSSCSDHEAGARKKYNEAMTLQQEGKMQEALSAYKEIVKQYPDTQTAVEANKILLSITTIKEIKLNQQAIDLHLKTIDVALKLFFLENGRYPSDSEGLNALLVAPSGYPNWKGPYLEGPAINSLESFHYKRNGHSYMSLSH